MLMLTYGLYTSVSVLTHSHKFTRWNPHLVMYLSLDIYTCSCIPMFISSLGYLSPWWHSHFSMYISVNRHPCSYDFMLISTYVHVSQFCYSDLYMYCCIAILTWLCVPLLHICTWLYMHMFYSHFVMHPHIDIHTWSCIAVLIFILRHISSCY